MPSVTDLQQQSSKLSSNSPNAGKAAASVQQQQQQMNTGNTTDSANVDPITQVVLLLEKKQRNLGKRKEKLESYQQEAQSGKELHKDQKEALSKYGEVIGQIECVKDVYEQVKKIQTETAKNQKRLLKQAAEEKRLLAAQRLREYLQLRSLLDHRPASSKAEQTTLLDELARVVVPSDLSSNAITRAVDTVLAIYQGGPASSAIKNLTGRTAQEVRETLEQLLQQQSQTPPDSQPPPATSAPVPDQQSQQPQPPSVDHTTEVVAPSLSDAHLIPANPNEYPLQFDTRNQNIPLQEIIQDNTFFPVDILSTGNNQQESSTVNQENQSTDSKQFVQTFHHPNQTQQEQETLSHVPTDEQPVEEQWQQRRSNGGNANRGGNYNRGAAQNNYSQQHWRGPRGGGHYDHSYNAGQRQYHENSNRAGGSQRGGPNPNYRGNRGGNYRGGNRGANAGYSGNGYQKSNYYEQQQQ